MSLFEEFASQQKALQFEQVVAPIANRQGVLESELTQLRRVEGRQRSLFARLGSASATATSRRCQRLRGHRPPLRPVSPANPGLPHANANRPAVPRERVVTGTLGNR